MPIAKSPASFSVCYAIHYTKGDSSRLSYVIAAHHIQPLISFKALLANLPSIIRCSRLFVRKLIWQCTYTTQYITIYLYNNFYSVSQTIIYGTIVSYTADNNMPPKEKDDWNSAAYGACILNHSLSTKMPLMTYK